MSNKIEIPSENKSKCPVVVVGDPKKQKQGVVVLQEWWGLNKQIQDEAAELSKQGNFVTIVPDLYRGKVATNNEDAGHYMGELDWLGAVKDIQACAQYLKKEGCTKVGVTGFCMGGALSLAAAAKVPEIDASAPFYGIPGADLADISTIKIPLQLHFGDLDDVAGFSDLEAQAKLQEKLKSGKVNYEFHCYKGCKHAFTNGTSPNFNKEAFQLSFKRLVEFFQKSLK